MNARSGVLAALLAALAGGGGYYAFQEALVPVVLVSDQGLRVPAAPEFGEDAAILEAVLPAGAQLEAFLAAQSDLTPLLRTPEGAWAGQLLAGLEGSRHGRRWRLSLKPGWPLQDGTTLDAARLAKDLAPGWTPLRGEPRVLAPGTLELRFREAQPALPELLSRWRVPGSGAFIRNGTQLTRFDKSGLGRAGIAGLKIHTDPSLRESRAWAEGLQSARWAWAAFPGRMDPEDMAKVRLAPYDEVRLKDGTVWFLSRRLRRLRPDAEDWTRTRLFGVWKGGMDLPYDPLGL